MLPQHLRREPQPPLVLLLLGQRPQRQMPCTASSDLRCCYYESCCCHGATVAFPRGRLRSILTSYVPRPRTRPSPTAGALRLRWPPRVCALRLSVCREEARSVVAIKCVLTAARRGET